MTARALDRRTLLVDLGRATLGAVVLGTTLAGCASDDGPPPVAGPDDAAWQRASFGFVSAYVLVRDGEALVFDTGTGQDGVGPIADALAAAGAGWADVGHVLVSHEHGDHVGGLDAIAVEASDAVLYGAMPDLDSVRDRLGRAQEVADGDTVLGLRVVATPGHTLGHVSALDEQKGLLLVGDALVNRVAIGGASGDGVEVSPPEFTADGELAAASARALGGLAFDTALFGHGEPIVGGAADEIAAATA